MFDISAREWLGKLMEAPSGTCSSPDSSVHTERNGICPIIHQPREDFYNSIPISCLLLCGHQKSENYHECIAVRHIDDTLTPVQEKLSPSASLLIELLNVSVDQSINGDSVAKTTPRIERNPSAQLAAKLGREPFIPKSVLGLTDKINAGVSTNELDEWKILKEEKQKLQEEWIRLNNEKMRLKMKEEEDWNRMKERKERLKLKYPQNLSRHGQSRSPPASPKPPLKLKTAAEVRNLSYDLWSRRSSHTFFESQKQIRERLRQLEKERRKQEEEKLKMSQEVYRCWISRKKEEAIAQKKRIKIEEEKLKEAQINERKHKEEAEKAFLAWKKEKETKKRSSKYPGFLRQKMHDHEIEKMKTAREAYELWQRQKKEMDKQNEIYGRRKKRLEEEQERIKQFKRKDLAKTSYEEWEIRKNSTMEDVKSIQDIPTFQRRPPWRPSSGQISARP